ncbi:putative HVA22-like protein g [Cucurbita pepo subsp. pepo]|uniref:putative HVA22-like protein g n=1 Tax=Cucurbita pepo subsp. pepo TaxID=3664 RepID=UPI000C9D2D67|nr:putative HVA22-like protein g [Cucurbita pepo subsp. pepo]
MLGELMVRCLLMLFGYAYPAFQCYKTVVQSRIEIRELQFWCQFWIIVAILTIVERIADTLVAWLPMYGELKLALFIYLWYPKTKGTKYVFDTLLRPLVDKHETDIEQKMGDWRVKGWELALFYWKNCTELSQSAIVQVINYIARPAAAAPEDRRNERHQRPSAPPAPPPPPPRPNDLPSFFHKPPRKTKDSSKSNAMKWFPSAPPLPGSSNRRSTATSEDFDVQFPLHDQTNYFYEDQNHNQARFRGSKKPY